MINNELVKAAKEFDSALLAYVKNKTQDNADIVESASRRFRDMKEICGYDFHKDGVIK